MNINTLCSITYSTTIKYTWLCRALNFIKTMNTNNNYYFLGKIYPKVTNFDIELYNRDCLNGFEWLWFLAFLWACVVCVGRPMILSVHQVPAEAGEEDHHKGAGSMLDHSLGTLLLMVAVDHGSQEDQHCELRKGGQNLVSWKNLLYVISIIICNKICSKWKKITKLT